MIRYIVRVWVEAAHEDAWSAYMRDEHLPEVFATGCFDEMAMARRAEADTNGEVAFEMSYLTDSTRFGRYNCEFGPALKADHVERFGAVTRAEREVMDVLLVRRNA